MSSVNLNARSASSGHAGHQPPELLDRAFERRRPGKAAAETNVVAIVGLGGEHDAGCDTEVPSLYGESASLVTGTVAEAADRTHGAACWRRDDVGALMGKVNS